MCRAGRVRAKRLNGAGESPSRLGRVFQCQDGQLNAKHVAPVETLVSAAVRLLDGFYGNASPPQNHDVMRPSRRWVFNRCAPAFARLDKTVQRPRIAPLECHDGVWIIAKLDCDF